jgi:hypothetical protein
MEDKQMSRATSAPTKQPQATMAKSPTPTQEQIALRAYEKWVKRGRPEGTHLQDWYEAEAELRKESSLQPGSGQRR